MNANYSYLYNNLSPKLKKYTNAYRALSPIVIKSFGGNNFVYERKYKSNKNNDIQDSEYDYIENELKNSKGIKAHTAYTELSTQENMSLFGSQMQMQNKRYYKNYTNINPEGEYYIHSGNDNSFLRERNDNKTRTYIIDNKDYRYKILKKEDINDIFYPNETAFEKNNYRNFKQRQNRVELISQSFSTSIIPEKKLLKSDKKNKVFEINYIKSKKSFPNKEIDLKIIQNSSRSNRRESSFSKSRIQLEDFNIEKLKEIGDNLALRYLNKGSSHQNNNIKSFNNANTEKKESGIIKNMIKIDEQRKNSKNKINLFMKNNDDIKKGYSINIDIGNVNKNKTPNKTDNIKNNNKIKIISIAKKNIKDLRCEVPPGAIKINLKHKMMGKKYNSGNNSDKNKRRILYYNNINSNTNNNINKINISNSNKKIRNNSENRILQNKQGKHKSNGPKKIKDNDKYPNYNNNKKININSKFKKIDLNNINHCYLETINIKKNNKTSKTKHSFNDIFLPPQ